MANQNTRIGKSDNEPAGFLWRGFASGLAYAHLLLLGQHIKELHRRWKDKERRDKRYVACLAAVARGRETDPKSPPAVAEAYILITMVFGLFLLRVSPVVPAGWCNLILSAAALYRPMEIFLFALGWVFIHGDPVWSTKRSLASLLWNMSEVVIYSAAAINLLDCSCNEEGMVAALYSSLRTALTIGPTELLNDGEPRCMLLAIGEIGMCFFLTVVCVACLAGMIRKQPVGQSKRTGS